MSSTMHRTLGFLLAVAATAAIGTAQASFTNYGRGCSQPGSPPPLIRFTGLPQLGATYTVNQIALPNSITPVSVDLPVLVTGLVQTSTPMPVLSSLQPPGCLILTSIDVLEIMPQVGSSGFQSSTNWSIPSAPVLLGLAYNHQWLSLYSRCTGGSCAPMMIRASDAATALIGP